MSKTVEVKFGHDFAERATRATSRALKITADVKRFFEGRSFISSKFLTLHDDWNKLYNDAKLGMVNADVFKKGAKVETFKGSGILMSLMDADVKKIVDAKAEYISGFELTDAMIEALPEALKTFEAQVKEATGYHKVLAKLAGGNVIAKVEANAETEPVS